MREIIQCEKCKGWIIFEDSECWVDDKGIEHMLCSKCLDKVFLYGEEI